ncbi:fasciclin domain-containing protein [Mucilaginibacter mali]|uniref:Fasciclin domain-containing protein n=1 Tax=Mucilaginibacter mali TaxID=2740462 RepID=A0A7D4UKS6_9SPHI|nr:fasciclin domain-containing protein [Mucilaginibacter mali]QKJ31082.1 fasciclin domain-containing protein [Mucilaginibacter mali]
MYKIILKSTLFMLLGLSLLSSCKRDEYFQDTGKADPNFNGTILAYLKSKPVNFDTLTRVINIAGMNDVFDKEQITFFAPTSSTIYKSIKALNADLRKNGRDTVSKLEQIKPQTWKDELSMYIFKGIYRLKDYPQLDTTAFTAFPGQGYTSYGGRTMNIGVIFNDAVTQRNSDGSPKTFVKYAGYRQLYLSYIPDFSTPTANLLNIPVSSSDIAPTNGIVHVLAQSVFSGTTLVSKHNFGFNTRTFIDKVIADGILPATP